MSRDRYGPSCPEFVMGRYAKNYDKSKQNTKKTKYANKQSFHFVRRTPVSWTPTCLYAGPVVPKCCRCCSHHSWKTTTEEGPKAKNALGPAMAGGS